MIITREAQLRLAAEYGEEKSTTELLAFFEGMQVNNFFYGKENRR